MVVSREVAETVRSNIKNFIQKHALEMGVTISPEGTEEIAQLYTETLIKVVEEEAKAV